MAEEAVVFPIYRLTKRIETRVQKALPSGTPGYLHVDPADMDHGHELAYSIVPKLVHYEPPDDLDDESAIQDSRWSWMVYLFINKREEEALKDCQTYLGRIMQALVGKTLDGFGLPVVRESAGFYGFLSAGSVFGLHVTVERNTGETP